MKRRIPRLQWLLPTWHMGVYAGNGRVIHFDGEKKGRATVREDDLIGFILGAYEPSILLAIDSFFEFVQDGRKPRVNGVNGSQSAVILSLAVVVALAQRVHMHARPRNPLHAESVTREARRLCNLEPNSWDGEYSFLFRNCEHFALHCFENPFIAEVST